MLTYEVQFVALNPWKANEFLLVVDNSKAYFVLDSSMEGEVKKVLDKVDIEYKAVVPYNPERKAAKLRKKPKIKAKENGFLREMLGHTLRGVAGGTAGGIVQVAAAALITGTGLCNVM